MFGIRSSRSHLFRANDERLLNSRVYALYKIPEKIPDSSVRDDICFVLYRHHGSNMRKHLELLVFCFVVHVQNIRIKSNKNKGTRAGRIIYGKCSIWYTVTDNITAK